MQKLEEFNKSSQEFKKIDKEEEVTISRMDKEITSVKDSYYKQKRVLDDKEYKETSKLSKSRDLAREKFENKKEKHISISENYRRILNLMEVIKETRNLGLSEPKVYHYDYIRNKEGSIESTDKVKFYYTPIGVLCNDDYKKLFVYIVNNSKPTNKFSLVVVGNSKFNKEIIELPYSYGFDAHTEDANIQGNIQDKPTEEELKEYFVRNQKRMLKSFLTKHALIEAEYLEVEKETDTKEWKLAYLENKKDYYENHYSGGIETKEYKEVVKEIEKLDSGD